MIKWPDGESKVGDFAQTLEIPLLFVVPRSLMTTVSHNLVLTSRPEEGCFSVDIAVVFLLPCNVPFKPLHEINVLLLLYI